MSSLRAPWQNGPYKNKHTEQHKNTQSTKAQQTFRINCFLSFSVLFYFFIYDFLNVLSQKCWTTALVRSLTTTRQQLNHELLSIETKQRYTMHPVYSNTLQWYYLTRMHIYCLDRAQLYKMTCSGGYNACVQNKETLWTVSVSLHIKTCEPILNTQYPVRQNLACLNFKSSSSILNNVHFTYLWISYV